MEVLLLLADEVALVVAAAGVAAGPELGVALAPDDGAGAGAGAGVGAGAAVEAPALAQVRMGNVEIPFTPLTR